MSALWKFGHPPNHLVSYSAHMEFSAWSNGFESFWQLLKKKIWLSWLYRSSPSVCTAPPSSPAVSNFVTLAAHLKTSPEFVPSSSPISLRILPNGSFDACDCCFNGLESETQKQGTLWRNHTTRRHQGEDGSRASQTQILFTVPCYLLKGWHGQPAPSPSFFTSVMPVFGFAIFGWSGIPS